MTIMRVTLVGVELIPEQKSDLARRLIAAFCEIEVGHDVPEAIVRDVAAMPKQGAGSDFWMTIVEAPDGAWGVGGRPVPIARLAPFFTEDRQERIREYLRHRA